MDGKQTVKYVAFYRVLATLASLVGLGLVGLGVMLGFGDSITILVNDAPQNWDSAVDVAQPITFVALSVVGVLVWQIGKTFALVKTMEKVAAVESGGPGGSGLPERVTERISSLESDVKTHEQKLSNVSGSQSGAATSATSGSATSSSTGTTSSKDDSSSRRSRRRGSAASGGDESGDASSAGGDGASERSNRRSNRRASRSDSGDDDSSRGSDDSSASSGSSTRTSGSSN